MSIIEFFFGTSNRYQATEVKAHHAALSAFDLTGFSTSISSASGSFHGCTLAEPNVSNIIIFATLTANVIQNTLRHSDCSDYEMEKNAN